MRALTEAHYRDAPGGWVDVSLLRDEARGGFLVDGTVCENCGTHVLQVDVRLGAGRQWERAWWEPDVPAAHTVERCRAARSERRPATNNPAPG